MYLYPTMPRRNKSTPLPVAAADLRSVDAIAFKRYLQADDAQQFEIMREKWSQLNWDVLHTTHEAARAVFRGEKKPGELSQLMLAAGVGFDKLYSKRPASVQPLSFPAPLLAMVRKGLELANKKRTPQPVVSEPVKPVTQHDIDHVSADVDTVNAND